MLNQSFVFRLFRRELQRGELSLLCIALFLAVTCMSAIQQLNAVVRNEITTRTAQLMGADAIVTQSTPIRAVWQKEASTLGLTQTTVIHFLSMAVHGEHLQLAQIKAIDSQYPLQGDLLLSSSPDGEKPHKAHAPKPGQAWLNPRLLPLLHIKIGQHVSIGMASFRVAGIIIDEPGQRGDWLSVSPQIIINTADVAKTKTIQKGSRVNYFWLLSGPSKQRLALKAFLQKEQTEPLSWSDAENDTPTIEKLTERTLSYLNLGMIMSLVLGGVAISMASIRYSQRHQQQVALMRCLGATHMQCMTIYLSHFLFVGVFSSSLGVLVGIALQPLLLQWLSGLLVSSSLQIYFGPMLSSFVTGILLLFCFSGGSLWRLRHITPVHIFAQQHRSWHHHMWLPYALASILLIGLSYLYTASWAITFCVVFVIASFISLVYLSLSLFAFITHHTRDAIPLNWRFGLNNIIRNRENSLLQISGIGLALTAMLSLYLFEHEVIHAWQQQLPAETANYFLINIDPAQVKPLKKKLQQEQITMTALYPMVKGRLVTINQEPVQHRFGAAFKDINALQRELNLSWVNTLPEGNQITKGRWFSPASSINWVSVEQGLAKELHLQVGDRIGFQIEDQRLEVEVVNLRQVDWGSFKPNFFMLLKPGLLNAFGQTMITSFYLAPNKQSILVDLVRTFPNLTVIDLASTLNKIRAIMHQMSRAIHFIALFSLLLGLTIATLAVLSFNSTKEQETKLLKILGMRRRSLLWIRSSEALILGLYTGLLSFLLATALCYYLSLHLLETVFAFPWRLLFAVPSATALATLTLCLVVQSFQYKQRP